MESNEGTKTNGTAVDLEKKPQETPEQSQEPKQHGKGLQFIIDTVKGFIIGCANVIPGVSGGTLALVLGIYEKLIKAISHLFSKKFGKNFMILLPILIGIVIAFLSMSHVITFCLTNFLFATIMLFFGAVIGGLPMLFKKVSGQKVGASEIIICVVTLAIVLCLLFVGQGSSMDLDHLNIGKILLFVVIGAVASATMVIPGVSGSAFMMTIGFYNPVMKQVANLTTAGADKGHAVAILVPFGIGIVLGIVFIAKLIEFLLRKYETKTYWGIIGFVIGSALIIILQNFFMMDGSFVAPALTIGGTSVLEYILGIVLAAGGFFGAYKLGDR